MDKAPRVLNIIICLPLKLDGICGFNNFFTKSVAEVCDDPSSVMDLNFERKYVQMKDKGFSKFTSNYGDISFNYTASNIKDLRVVKLINGTSQKIGNELREKSNFAEKFLQVVGKFMILVYFKVLYGTLFHFVQKISSTLKFYLQMQSPFMKTI